MSRHIFEERIGGLWAAPKTRVSGGTTAGAAWKFRAPCSPVLSSTKLLSPAMGARFAFDSHCKDFLPKCEGATAHDRQNGDWEIGLRRVGGQAQYTTLLFYSRSL
jgi:hypothetical protein